MDLGHSVQFLFLRVFLDFQVVFSVRRIRYRGIARQNPVIASSELRYNNFS